MLRVTNLCKQYNTSSTYALDHVSFQTSDKGLIFILGESGSGKTTLLNILGTLDIGTSGNVYFYDEDIQNYSNKEKEDYRNNLVGFIFQEHNLLSHLNVRDNILISEDIQSKKHDSKRYEEIIKLLDLQGLDKRYPHELSTGQKQRVAIARALIKNSRLILADEPTGSLDYENATNVMGYLKDISKNILVIVVSHDREFASIYADRIIELKKGKVISDRVISSNEEIVNKSKKELLLNENRLSFKSNFKYILSNIRTKIFSTILLVTLITLVVTILTVLSFIVKYDNIKFLLENMEKTNDNIVSVVYAEYPRENIIMYPGLKNENVTELRTKFPDYTFYPVYKSNIELLYYDSSNEFFEHQNSGLMEVDNNILDSLDFKLIVGNLPKKNDKYIEIAISKYTYLKLASKYLRLIEGDIYVDSYQSILDKTIYRNGYKYKIVGIIDTKYNHEKTASDYYIDFMEKNDVHNALFTYKGYYKDIELRNEENVFKVNIGSRNYLNISSDTKEVSVHYIQKMQNENIIFLDGYSFESITANDIVVTSEQLDKLFYNGGRFSSISVKDKIYYFAKTNFLYIKEDFEKDHGPSDFESYYFYILDNKFENKYQPGYDYMYFVRPIISNILSGEDKYKVEISIHKNIKLLEKELNIVGIIYDDYDYYDYNNEYLYVNEELYNELYEYNDGEITYAITKIDFSKDNTELMKSIYLDKPNYKFFNGIKELVVMVDISFETLEQFYYYCWLVLIVFTIIVVYYISKSLLKNEKQKIGLLIALGVKQSDILRLLIYEYGFILLISLPINFITTAILTSYLNNIIKTKYVLYANAITYNPIIIILIFIVVMIISVLIYLRTLYKYSSKSAISIIKNNA